MYNKINNLKITMNKKKNKLMKSSKVHKLKSEFIKYIIKA